MNLDEVYNVIQKRIPELFRVSVRCVDEVWREDPAPVRDGTKMVMIPEVIFKRLEKVVVDMQGITDKE